MLHGWLPTTGEPRMVNRIIFKQWRPTLAKYKDKANVEFVIPAEGTLVVPYVMSLVNKGPNAANGRKVLDFVLSDEGQAIWANAYLRPVRASAIPKEVQSRFLPATEYARARTVDYAKMAEVQKAFSDRYLKEAQ